MRYTHTQRGTLILAVTMGMAVGLAIAGVAVTPAFFITAPILVILGWLFSSLTIEVDERELRWRFGPGLIAKKARLEEIAAAQPVRTHFLEGWGIHLSRFGWLYNVSGWDAVAITMRNGRRFALGTDEPKALLSALQQLSPSLQPA